MVFIYSQLYTVYVFYSLLYTVYGFIYTLCFYVQSFIYSHYTIIINKWYSSLLVTFHLICFIWEVFCLLNENYDKIQ